MVLKLALDAGHAGFGVTPGKRTPAGEYEWHFNDANVDAFIKEINNYEGVKLKLVSDPNGKIDIPLRERTDRANEWGADLFLSFHHNAITGTWGNWGGTETFTYNKIVNPKSVALGKVMHAGALKAYGLYDRGLKKANFHVLRETKMPAALVEGGFMDSRTDIKVMRDPNKLAALGRQIAINVAKEYGLKKKAAPKPVQKADVADKVLYRVQVGAFKTYEGIAKFSKAVEDKTGFNTYATEVGGFMKLQVGAFGEKANAEKRLADLKAKGYTDAFITTEVGEAVALLEPQNEPEPPKPIRQSNYEVAKDIVDGVGGWGNGDTRKARLRAKGYNPSAIQAIVNDILKPQPKTVKNGSRVRINTSAKQYANSSVSIPSRIKGRTYTVSQISSDKKRVLLKEIFSWVYVKDITVI